MRSFRDRCIWPAVLVLLAGGCSGQKPEKKLLGSWIGAASMNESIDRAVDSAGQGQKVNPLARGAAQFLGKKLAEATMSIEIDFRSGGRVFFRGNTDVLGFPHDSDGTWEVTSSGPDFVEIRFGTEAKQLEGKVLFRNKDEFTLKLTQASASAHETKEATEPAAQLPSSIVFKRNGK